MKKFVSLLVAILMSMLCFAVPVYAESDAESVTRDSNYPSGVWNLATDGTYYLEGYGQSNGYLYSLKYFTGKSTYAVHIDNLGANYTITVRLVKNTLIDYTVHSFTVSPGNSVDETITDLSSNSQYYLKFSCPCYFEGTVS
jgi:hypothetical protein